MIIAKVQSVYPFIKDISMYNFTNGEYIDTFGLPRDPRMNARSNADYLSFYPRVAVVGDDSSLRLLTFSIVPERSGHEHAEVRARARPGRGVDPEYDR